MVMESALREVGESFGEVHGCKFLIDSNDNNISQIIKQGQEWEPQTTEWILKLIRSNRMVFVDVGAHIGYFTCLVAKTNPYSMVYAFESNPYTFSYLQYNVFLNDLHNVNIYPWPLADKNKRVGLGITNHGNTGDSSVHEWNNNEHFVPALCIDSIFKDVDIVKIDCESYDHKILEGGTKLFRDTTKRMDVFFERGCEDLLSTWGYGKRGETNNNGQGPCQWWSKP